MMLIDISKILLVIIAISFKNHVQGQEDDEGLTSESVSEGPCIDDIGSRVSQASSSFFASTPRNYYVPIASEACYRSYAEVLLGRPAINERELNAMKLRIRFHIPPTPTPTPPMFITTGFRNRTMRMARRIHQTCPPYSSNQVLCLPIAGGSFGTDTSGIATSLDTVYYTDNMSTILIIRCLNMKVKDYKVLTTEKTVTPGMQMVITEKITELGFDPSLLRVKKY